MPDKEELLLFLDFGSAAAIKAASKAMEQPVKLGKTPLHSGTFSIIFCHQSHPAKIDLNKKCLPKPKTIHNFNIDAQGFRKTRNENPPMREIGVTS